MDQQSRFGLLFYYVYREAQSETNFWDESSKQKQQQRQHHCCCVRGRKTRDRNRRREADNSYNKGWFGNKRQFRERAWVLKVFNYTRSIGVVVVVVALNLCSMQQKVRVIQLSPPRKLDPPDRAFSICRASESRNFCTWKLSIDGFWGC